MIKILLIGDNDNHILSHVRFRIPSHMRFPFRIHTKRRYSYISYIDRDDDDLHIQHSRLQTFITLILISSGKKQIVVNLPR